MPHWFNLLVTLKFAEFRNHILIDYGDWYRVYRHPQFTPRSKENQSLMH